MEKIKIKIGEENSFGSTSIKILGNNDRLIGSIDISSSNEIGEKTEIDFSVYDKDTISITKDLV